MNSQEQKILNKLKSFIVDTVSQSIDNKFMNIRVGKVLSFNEQNATATVMLSSSGEVVGNVKYYKGATQIAKDDTVVIISTDLLFRNQKHIVGVYGGAVDIVDTSSIQSLINKTLTNPTINFTDKAVTQNVMCRAYLGTDQLNLTNSAYVKMLLDTESFDVGSDFNTTDSKFVAPVTGYYHVDAQIRYSHTEIDKLYILLIYVNGSAVRAIYESIGSDSNDIAFVFCSDMLQLSATDYVELYARQLSGVDTVDIANGSLNTFMSIHLVSV